MAYQKVNADRRAPGHSQYLDNDDLQATALDLEWDMEKELEEPGFDQFQLDSAENQNLENSETADLNLDPIQPATSPKGRFQRLQEESDYVTHYTRSAPKSNPCNFCRLLKIFCTAIILFISGILIGYYAHKNCSSNATSSGTLDLQLYQEILKTIQAEDIRKSFRNLVQLYKSENDIEISKKIKTQWTSLGLEDVQFVNYSVLLNLPGPSPSSVSLSSSGQCFHPNGQPCSKEARQHSSQDLLYSYAAYSASGTLKAEVIDVSYGNADDLNRIKKMKNVTNQIALLKLGKLPLLYKLSLLEKAGFGGVLLYIDPCDLPKTANLSYDTFMVSLNPGGDPSTPGYPSIDGSFRQNRSNLTSLLVQPISASLVAKLISSPKDRITHSACSPLELPNNEERIVSMQIQTVTKFETVTNVVGYLKGSTSPDRYIIVGSHHHTAYSYNGQEWASSTAIITAFIRALMLRVKRGWRPDRTIVFCSWGGTAFGNIGSYEWGEDFKKVLQKNVVAYVSLHSPVSGNSSLYSVASPSLQQLVAEKNNFNCSRRGQCPETNISSVQMQDDADYFINHLGVPTVRFTYEDIKALEGPSFLSEGFFPKRATKIEEMDPFFKLHETITKLSGEVILQIANEPVLPFNAIDIALEVQNSLKGDQPNMPQLLALASRLRESAELFQSDEMRPANDPKERAPIRVRMLNEVLQDMEKSFLVQHAPPGFYRKQRGKKKSLVSSAAPRPSLELL
ncbi:inactive N-acetylated-alpha-linked acidic dipeptidase-like protein 2 [Physeter macrocephalus]|uniref:Inactive N-acetylated-alpha-linked acidic dipeptidase-like protein 2 n=1 Tax=Physeter macrocephalus TaxID=9755 RepID=A0A9W2WLE0_PHYMC|nr:inactive N-acetylated-alpha-linked acidic dipeptidase-like protein 2 [Physeter catodon]XP_054939817.1 inactive N-acetylated-alpha-linked acidic dipeptidase-like protein 2 [Physeter catodon]XP_054939819.1 inactive N-acetylated-alpha-linked acidic dipeptidase-like protein 2 [Physeter catodon]XP_054939820.1 inactive N-acetylated-alpha-linked acidic dipeptidase-like protein 2 [Physeter catodon]XP_054939823.1 inactive N-acetylated-alpha-linked acidic dipeptidase-like protein 2 [Physeter catodon]